MRNPDFILKNDDFTIKQKPEFDTFQQAAPQIEAAPAPAQQAAPPRQAPQQQLRPPAPMLKYYYDDSGFDRALEKMRGGRKLQYKCQVLFESSIENAEIMWNFPWKMMILC